MATWPGTSASGNSYTALTTEQREFYVGTLLTRLLPNIPLMADAKKDSIPQRNGTRVNWRWMSSFPVATTALAEGVAPASTPMTWNSITADTKQYGAFAKITDLAVLQTIDPVLTEASEGFGENAGQTLHRLTVNELVGLGVGTGSTGTSVRYADGVGGRAAVAVANVLDAAEVRRARRILAGNNAVPFDDGYFHALIHPYAMESLLADAAVMSIAQYGAGGISKQGGVDLLKGRVVYFGGFKFMESTDAPTFTGTAVATVYGTLFYGKDAFGVADLAADPIGSLSAESNKLGGIDIKVIPYDRLDRTDPLGQYGTAGWICRGFVAALLDNARMVRIEHAVAA